MNPTIYFLLAVAVSAVITFGLRALPFFFFRGEKNDKNMPDWLLQLGIILPSAIMAVLIPSVRTAAVNNTPHFFINRIDDYLL